MIGTQCNASLGAAPSAPLGTAVLDCETWVSVLELLQMRTANRAVIKDHIGAVDPCSAVFRAGPVPTGSDKAKSDAG